MNCGLNATCRSGPLYEIAIASWASPKSGLDAVISSRLLLNLILTELDFSLQTNAARCTHWRNSSRSNRMR